MTQHARSTLSLVALLSQSPALGCDGYTVGTGDKSDSYGASTGQRTFAQLVDSLALDMDL